jgi:DNA polymerase III epsilon subunit-like protein
MDIITIDMETYYDREYSLSKMTTEAYVRDPRFEVVGVAIKVNGFPTDWYSGSDPGKFLRQLNYRDKAILCHNTAFDGAILSWHYGIRPKLWLDTLSMARPLHGSTIGVSLKALATHYGLGEKGDEVLRTLGMRRADFTPEAMARYAEYCVKDVDLTYALFRKLAKGFPSQEIQLIDTILRMYTEPSLVLDTELLSKHLDEVVARKQALLDSFGQAGDDDTKSLLMSNEKFAAYLRDCGVEPPTKISKTTGKLTYAFSKTDSAFTSMVEHPDERVSTAVAARLGVKSTIEESRTRSLLGVASRGPLPIMLNYYGAHTGRLSGGDKMNLQNLPRGGALRRSLCAPDGKLLVACDSSQIEARVVAWLAGQSDLLEAFAQGRDVYSEFASAVYQRKVNKSDKLERFVGKTCLGPNTRVLTRRGWVPIIQVRGDDQLWDGVEWVNHCGVSFMGVKQTIRLSGLELTPDHEILTGATKWEPALTVLKNSTAFQSALSLATLPLSGIKSGLPHQVNLGVGALCAAVGGAGPNLPTPHLICELVDPQPVTDVPSARHPTSGGGSTSLPFQMIYIEADCSTAYHRQYPDATTQETVTTRTMASAESRSVMSGEPTTRSFCATFRPSADGMTLAGTWTASITIKGMRRETYGSLQGRRTPPTSDESPIWRPVFDILNSGSRNRFTVLTNDGPIIVHNCILGLGYGMGAAKFRDTLALGMGGIKVEIDEVEAKRIVKLYREKNSRIAMLWTRCSSALNNIAGGMEFDIAPKVLASLVTTKEGIRLPNGLSIRYPALQETGQDGYVYASDQRQFREALRARVLGEPVDADRMTRIYGGKVVENIVQAVARIVVTDQLVEISKRYKVVLQVHDEVVIVCDEDEAEEAKAFVMGVMSTPPEWAKGLPVACEADVGKTYGDAK